MTQVKLLRIFVSSPGDVKEERDVLDNVIHRVNVTDGQSKGVRLEIFRWERNVPTAVGSAPQDVVNDYTPAYEIFLGIMAKRFGTPTERYGSGTEEEFHRALETREASAEPDKPWIMFFFMDAPSIRTPEELEQYRRVLDFKAEVAKHGIIATYTTLRGSESSFAELVEHHLRLVVQKLSSAGPPPGPGPKPDRNEKRLQDQQFGKYEPPPVVDERQDLVTSLQPQIFDVISPCYLLDENFYFLDWNIAFEELIAKPLALTREDHGLDFVRQLANCDSVMEHSTETFGVGRENPIVDSEMLQYHSPKFGLIEFFKIAVQLTDDSGNPIAWCVNLNIVLAEKYIELREHLKRKMIDRLNWTRYAVSYDRLLLPFDDYHQLVDLVVSKLENARNCLDLGAGTGNGTLRLLETDPERLVWAVESNEGMLRYLRRKVHDKIREGSDFAERLTQVKDDIVTLNSMLDPEKNEFFDGAVMVNVLYAVDDPAACLRRVNQLLKPGGVLAFSTPHEHTDVDRLFARIRKVLTDKGDFHNLRKNYIAAREVHEEMMDRIHRDSKDDIRKYVKDAGFEIVDWHEREYVGAVLVVKAIKAKSVN